MYIFLIYMKIYKDRGTISGFRYEAPLGEDLRLTHAGEYWSSRHHFVRAHSHPVWEFLYQMQAQTVWRQDGYECAVGPGDLLVCPPWLPHGMAGEPAAEFRICFFGTSLEDNPELGLDRLLPKDQLLVINSAHSVQPYLLHLLKEVTLSQPHRREAIILARQQFLIAVARLLAAGNSTKDERLDHELERVKTLIREMPGEPWKLETLARMTSYSPGYFSGIFRRQTGQTPHAFLLEARIDRARELLSQRDRSITEIAHELGFSSSQHFATTFRKFTGLSPRAYHGRDITIC